MSFAGLFHPVDQAGDLMKMGHKRPEWQRRFFVLKGNFLFYFKGRRQSHLSKRLHCVIPLENAKIETELPDDAAMHGMSPGWVITITLHSTHAFTCKHPFYVLSAPSEEVQMAWVNAMFQAAIPRADLIQHLVAAGKLPEALAAYSSSIQNNFPVADAAVVSTGGRARTAALANLGTLPSTIRRDKAAPVVGDVTQLPMVVPDRPVTPASVLARTETGSLVTASPKDVMHRAESPFGPAPGASSAPTSPTAAPSSFKKQPQAVVAMRATAGASATAAASGSDGEVAAEEQGPAGPGRFKRALLRQQAKKTAGSPEIEEAVEA